MLQITILNKKDIWFRIEHGKAMGVICNRVFWLMVLRIEENFQNLGFGSYLVKGIAKWCTDEGVRRIEVDDMSNRYRQPQNVYRKCGFVYHRAVGPEMYASPRKIIETLSHLNPLQKYEIYQYNNTK